MAEQHVNGADTLVLVARHRERMAAILAGYDEANRVLHDGDAPVILPFDLESRAIGHALVSLLVSKGLISEEELLPLKLLAVELVTEQHLEQYLAVRASRSGIFGPNGQAL